MDSSGEDENDRSKIFRVDTLTFLSDSSRGGKNHHEYQLWNCRRHSADRTTFSASCDKSFI